MELAFGAFEGEDMNLARQVEPLEQVIDVINMEEKQRHILRLRQEDVPLNWASSWRMYPQTWSGWRTIAPTSRSVFCRAAGEV